MYGIQQSTGIDGAETVLFPIAYVLIFCRKSIVFIFADAVAYLVVLTTDGNFLLTQVLQLKVSTLTVGQLAILFQRNLLIQSVVVRTIVGDVQLTVTSHE